MVKRQNSRLVDAAVDIRADPPERIDFLPAVLCHVGLPRRRPAAITFERTSGSASLRVEAGALWDGRKWLPQPLPYGTRPRLTLIHATGEAVRTRSPVVAVGDSIRDFMQSLGLDTGGHEHRRFKTQINALAACRMQLGYINRAGAPSTISGQPIERFDAWLHPTGHQRTLWPGTLQLSQTFFETVLDSAVPLDHRALATLKGSSLALDVYSWAAHRLCRVKAPAGVRLSWQNLHDQFGQEYGAVRDFKRELRHALRAVMTVYPGAKIETVDGGLLLRPSRPPIPRTVVQGRARAVQNPADE